LARRTTPWIVASVGVALLGLLGFGIVLWGSVQVDQADAADARRRFEEVRHDFPSPPLIAWDAGGRLTRNAPRAARGPRPSQLHVLVYRLREERLVQADAPLWFYKMKGSAVNYALRGTGFDLAALGLTAAGLEEAGAGLVVDETRTNGDCSPGPNRRCARTVPSIARVNSVLVLSVFGPPLTTRSNDARPAALIPTSKPRGVTPT